jgi:hypothetical protein
MLLPHPRWMDPMTAVITFFARLPLAAAVAGRGMG